jgi:hypothetical protein
MPCHEGNEQKIGPEEDFIDVRDKEEITHGYLFAIRNSHLSHRTPCPDPIRRDTRNR